MQNARVTTLTAKEHQLHQAGIQIGYARGLEAAAGFLTESGKKFRESSKDGGTEQEGWLAAFDQLADHLRRSASKLATDGQKVLTAALVAPNGNRRPRGRFLRVVEAIDRALHDE